MSKSTNGEVEKRINKIYDLLVNGASRAQIIQYASEKAKWDLTDRQIDTYIATATQRLIEIGKTHREVELGRAVARLNNLYFMSISLQNFNVALGVQKELSRILGLTSPVKHEITTTNGLPILDATTIAAELLRLKALGEGKPANE